MSKSKSRQPSRQASAANRNRSSGAARPASSAGKTTTEVAVDDSAGSEETQASAATKVKEVPSTPATDKPAKAAIKETPSTPAPGKSAPAARAATKTVPATPARSVASASASSKGLSRDAAKYERRQAERQLRYLAERRRRRNITFSIIGIVLAVLIIGGGTFYFVYQARQPKAATTTTTNQAPFQEAIYNSSYPPIDNVYCDALEQSVEHIHSHLSIYIDGKPSPLPQYIGIPVDQQSGSPTCYYWLHTHDSSGIIHIESPSTEPFTLGQFIDEWNQGFQSVGFPSQLLLNTGWTIWVNGKSYHGTLDSIPLSAHALITIAYNSPNAKPDTTYNWGSL